MGLGCPRWPHRSWRVSPRCISLCSKVSTPQTIGTTSDRWRTGTVKRSPDRAPLMEPTNKPKYKVGYPLVNCPITMENHHVINGKINYVYGHFPVRYVTAITRGYPMNDPNDITINCSVTPCWATAVWSLDSSASHLPSPATLQRSKGEKIWTFWEGLGRIISIMKGLYRYCYS